MLTEAVRTNAQRQEQFQVSNGSMSEMESDLDSTDSDELVGLFRLHSMEPCLVTVKNTLCGRTPKPTSSAR